MRHFALLKTSKNRWAFGEAFDAGFQRLSEPPKEGGYFWSPDFFMEDPKPFLKPKRFLMLTTSEVRECLQSFVNSPFSSPFPFDELLWSKSPRSQYQVLFKDLEALFQQGQLKKAVPVVIDEAQLKSGTFKSALSASLLFIFDQLAKLPDTLHPFILCEDNEWMFGATPETLIHQQEGRLKTHAVAGTTARLEKDLLKDPKEMSEHLFVVEEIQRVLESFGQLKTGRTYEKTLPSLKHLVTDLELEFHNAEFNKVIDIATLLHPTPALGGSPKDTAFHWLKQVPNARSRRKYGAPFGYVSTDGEAHIVVAIRALQVVKQSLLSIAGAGIVKESVCENEWDEILLKKRSVFQIFQESVVE